jgi:starch synthase
MGKPLKILLVAAECTPFAKTGGLADVAGALPKALKALGHDVRVILPFYNRKMDTAKYPARPLPGALDVALGRGDSAHNVTAHLLESRLPGSEVPVYLVDHHSFFDREELYQTADGDYEDNPLRFSFFCRSVLAACKHLDFKPDLFHCNDWHAALVPAYLKTLYAHDHWFERSATLFTIHNIAYQGVFAKDTLNVTGLPDAAFTSGHMEYYGQFNFMKGGLTYSDLVNTVSPQYSKEIQTSEYGFGLEGVLQARSHELFGILNGIDTADWDPRSDRSLAATYGSDDPERKAENKRALLEQMGLEADPPQPLLGMISRLDSQKGFDLLAEVMDYLMNFDIHFIVLGTGERKYHELFEKVREHYPHKACVNLTFDVPLAHKIMAASDIFLMPSRFEPCGLNQFIALRYGAVPVVRATGGLVDSVKDYDPKTGLGNGFTFHEYASMPFFNAIKRAVETYEDRETWRKLMVRGMEGDYSWGASAQKYVELYEKAIAKRSS